MEKSSTYKRKVCIIDDEDDIREIYAIKLKSLDFEVIEASNGEDGIQLIRQARPDIILLDLQMPVKNGLEVLEEMKHDGLEIPVVVLSNIDDEETMGLVGEFDTRFYLVKSLTSPDKIANIVKEVLH